jgi:glucose/arabinose dehydrogenase
MANLIVGTDAGNVLDGGGGSDVIYGYDPGATQGEPVTIAATRVASGLNQPLYATAPPGDASRLFIVEKGGLVKVLDLNTQQVSSTPFLDVSAQVTTAGECGLLGLAFDPDFATNGFVYVNLINLSGDTEIRRYQVSAGDPNQLDPASAQLVISIDQPDFTNHKAGWLGFGPDGYLYAALGDGGNGNDPFDNAQNLDSLLGKMLRLDVHADAFPEDDTRNYAVPADNPFVDTDGADEIWALGLRNPWRDSFDRALGDLFIGDVGQNAWEEIDLGSLGANYGWDLREGPAPGPGSGTPGTLPLVDPIHAYATGSSQAVTGGYVYRGPSDALQGQYFFADFIHERIFTLGFNGTTWVATERTAQIVPDAGTIDSPASFGEDALGNLYVVDIFDGEVFRLTPQAASPDQGDTLSGFAGDDMLYGGAGDDLLMGGADNDSLFGGDGADTLRAEGGDDILLGGAGNDVFQLAASALGAGDAAAGDADIIVIGAGDVLDIDAALAAALEIGGVALADGDTIGAALDGSTNIAFDNGGDLLMVDVNGDGSFVAAEDFSIGLAGVATVTWHAAGSSFSFTLDP